MSKLIDPTCIVNTRIKKHCTGCGLQFMIEMLSEPILFQEPEAMLNQIRKATSELMKAKCPQCKKKANQIDWFSI